MPSKVKRDPLPEHFASLEQAAEFWETHDLTDYDDMLEEAEFEVDLKERVFLTALRPDLAKRLTSQARWQGVSTETLVNDWLLERLALATGGK